MLVFVVIAKWSVVWVLLVVMVSWWLMVVLVKVAMGVCWHLFRVGSQEGFVVASMVFSGVFGGGYGHMVLVGYGETLSRASEVAVAVAAASGGDDC
nr:hypothetical protein [Tanacetum cinerariifolium]